MLASALQSQGASTCTCQVVLGLFLWAMCSQGWWSLFFQIQRSFYYQVLWSFKSGDLCILKSRELHLLPHLVTSVLLSQMLFMFPSPIVTPLSSLVVYVLQRPLDSVLSRLMFCGLKSNALWVPRLAWLLLQVWWSLCSLFQWCLHCWGFHS